MKSAASTETTEAKPPLGSTWFRVSGHKWGIGKIEELTVLRSTSARVMLKNGASWENKVSHYHRWFETDVEAVAFLRELWTRNAEYHEKKAAEYRAALAS